MYELQLNKKQHQSYQCLFWYTGLEMDMQITWTKLDIVTAERLRCDGATCIALLWSCVIGDVHTRTLPVDLANFLVRWILIQTQPHFNVNHHSLPGSIPWWTMDHHDHSSCYIYIVWWLCYHREVKFYAGVLYYKWYRPEQKWRRCGSFSALALTKVHLLRTHLYNILCVVR